MERSCQGSVQGVGEGAGGRGIPRTGPGFDLPCRRQYASCSHAGGFWTEKENLAFGHNGQKKFAYPFAGPSVSTFIGQLALYRQVHEFLSCNFVKCAQAKYF